MQQFRPLLFRVRHLFVLSFFLYHRRLLLVRTLLLLLHLPLLIQPHRPKVPRSPKLRSGEDAVQDGRDDLEHECPTIVDRAPEVEYDNGLNDSTGESDAHGGEEDLCHENVVFGVPAVQDDGDVGPEFGKDVECAWSRC